MLRSIILLLCLGCYVIAANAMYQGNTNYFPQHVGDEHVYRKTGRLAEENAGWTDTITGKLGQIFIHSNFFGDGVPRGLKVNNNTVIEKYQGRRFVWYRFKPAQSDWIINLGASGVPCVDGADVRMVSTNETVQVPAGTFQKCLKLEFVTNCADAGITEQWFAPGVGLVKQTETTIGGPLVSELVSAKVGKRIY